MSDIHECVMSFAQDVPGAQILLVAEDQLHHYQELCQAGALDDEFPWECRLDNGSKVIVLPVDDESMLKLGGYEFQCIAYDYDPGAVVIRYLQSRLRAVGKIRENLDAAGRNLTMIHLVSEDS